MRKTQEMSEVMNTEGYVAANNILQDVLQKKSPSMDLLRVVYRHKAELMLETIVSLYDNKNFVPGTLRQHRNAPTILSDMRQLADMDDDFGDIEEYFSNQLIRTESVDYLTREITSNVGRNIENKFGQYAEDIIKTSAIMMHLQSERDTHFVSSLAHWFGVASILYFLHETNNIPTTEIEKHKLAAEGFFHDFKEDLLSRIMDQKGQAYTIYRSDEFMQKHMPAKDLITDINGVSNMYASILKYAYGSIRRKDKTGAYSIDTETFTKDALLLFLANYLDKNVEIDSKLYAAHDTIYKVISDADYGKLKGGKLLDAMKLDTYTIYAHEITGHRRIIKFADQTYNLMGIKGLSSKRVPDTLIKTWAWSSEVYGSAVNLSYMDNFVEELLEDTLCHAEYFIISDMRVNEANRLYATGWFNNLIKLSPVFYTDRKITHLKH